MSVTILDNPQNHSEVALEESQFMEAVPEISIHVLARQLNFTTLRLTGRYGNHMLQVLVDNVSTHNFLKETVSTRLGLSILPCKSFKVFVGNGQYLECSKKCHGVNLFIQKYQFTIHMFILPIQGTDSVLGVQWLKQLGPVVTDYQALTMDFCLDGNTIHFVAESFLNHQPLQAKQLKKLTSGEEIDQICHLMAISNEDIHNAIDDPIPPEIATVIT
ncbi:RVP_2 domain-containing protein [Cephalotus follicularis]|uniref:RVP_2 domain-containing protein n=1 Tax=Cephalotus follicularis TaxID=3775 RepID=A0A1Q3B3U2_CEPFO|nr:RVP_2 domain-containing protein [Cephalotus follicularis]